MRNFFGARHSALGPRPSQRGIALVITLILLSVTLVMAVAFLAISNRERSSVTTTTDATTARLAAETALAQAESQIISTMLATTNPYNYGLIVSTNYINPAGFDPSVVGNPTNVNYDYQINTTTPLTAAQLQQNIANLYFSPRVPVYIVTNQSAAADFRFYLDLNRNGNFDDSGLILETNSLGLPTGNTLSEVGDPQWVGVLERPDTTHGPNNKFLSRYAFVALPVGNTLDINYIHNDARRLSPGFSDDGFFRNQGVGSWEINLAAFLADLNTNQWYTNSSTSASYYDYEPASPISRFLAFDDAMALLDYRYDFNYNALASVIGLYPNGAVFQDDNIDEYSDGPLQTSTTNINEFFNQDNTALPWSGAENANHFFNLTSDVFDPTKTSVGVSPAQVAANNYFTGRLLNAGAGPSTYDRYTFYRMLSQLGTDSTPESGLMNVNYDNLDPGFNGALVANGTASVTNYVPWTPIGFFTNAADRMLRLYTTNWFLSGPSNYLATYYGLNYTNPITIDQFGEVNGLTNAPFPGMTNQIPAFGIGNIPVLLYGNFMYPPAVQRVLQLAANIYDATTNNTFAGKDFPSVFRPTFLVTNEFGYNDVYINGYEYIAPPVSGFSDPRLNVPVDVTSLLLGNTAANPAYPNGVNVYGIPWVIGAKKGFPNFNEFSMESIMHVTRKLQFFRTTNGVTQNYGGLPAKLTATNQMYIFSITNSYGIECWNSYTNGYSNSVQIVVRDNLLMTLTNASPLVISSNNIVSVLTNVNVWPGSTWAGNALDTRFPSPLIIPIKTNVLFMPDSAYESGAAKFVSVGASPPPNWDANVSVLAQFGLQTTNRLQVFMLDTTGSHIIDYVQFSGPDSSQNVNAELADPFSTGVPAYMWSSNLLTGSFVPYGVVNQINVSSGSVSNVPSVDGGQWTTPPGIPSSLVALMGPNAADALFFKGFLSPNSTYNTPGKIWTNTLTSMQAPYTPTRVIVQYTSWQANDPLVHYIASDLNFSGVEQPSGLRTGITNYDRTAAALLPDLGNVNVRYAPWGTAAFMATIDANAFNLAYKDPLMWQSDDWDFPISKLPGVGWLGRIHRGTPWQTVYLKSSGVNLNTWTNWTGDLNDAGNMVPGSDRLLFDVFTAAPNDNATRGQLSINQTNLASWSALFSGMVVLTNTAPLPQVTGTSNNWMIINPVGLNATNSALWQLVYGTNGINNTRTNTALFPVQAFTHKGDILATPQLTVQSPFLNTNTATAGGNQLQSGISDELYEWLPQQAMSLLRAPSAPRYVIYCYGQALKPAPNGLVTSSGPFFQMITNYQVVTESAARAVIRVEGANTKSPHIVVESFNLLPPD